ncbi:hypothetical protein [Sinorhizobium sp. FG01]|nr:hypothetical protein [Sinorhizobium sp. FG01]
MDDFKIIVRLDFVGRENAVLAVDGEEGDRGHQVAGKLKGVGLCE